MLGERRKLREPRPHSTGLRISGGEKIPSSLVGLTRIAGKVIPNPVEVDTLPACHQPFGIRSMKVEVPNSGILENLGPGVNARNWRVHNHQLLNLVGVSRGVGVCDHVADVVSNNKCPVVSQLGDNSAHVLGLSLLVVSIHMSG